MMHGAYNVKLGKTFCNFLSKKEVQELEVLLTFLLTAFLEETFIRNIIITTCINHKIWRVGAQQPAGPSEYSCPQMLPERPCDRPYFYGYKRSFELRLELLTRNYSVPRCD